MALTEKSDKYKLKSLENALDLIELLRSSETELGITEISRQMGLGKSTIHRILTTLMDQQYVMQNALTEKYTLSFKFVTVANDILQKLDIVTVTRDVIEGLVEAAGVTAFLSAYSNYSVTAIERYVCKNERSINYNTGTCLPAHATASGKAIVGSFRKPQMDHYFKQVSLEKRTPYTITEVEALREAIRIGQELGYCENIQESDEGIVAFAVPVLGYGNSVPAAVSLCGPLSKMMEIKEGILPALIKTGEECSKICKRMRIV